MMNAHMAPTAKRIMEQVLAVRPGERMVIVTEAVWREALDLDFFAAVRIVRLTVPNMNKGGRIVLIGAAPANLTTGLAEELAPDLVINCASPWASYTTGQSIIVDGGLVRAV